MNDLGEVQRFLVTGKIEDLLAFHVRVMIVANSVLQRGQTVLYTCFEAHREAFLDAAEEEGVTVQEWEGDSGQWVVIVDNGPGWSDEPAARAVAADRTI